MKILKIIIVCSVAAVVVPFISFAIPFSESWRWPFLLDYSSVPSVSVPPLTLEETQARDALFSKPFIPTPFLASEEIERPALYTQLDLKDRLTERDQAARAAARERERAYKNQSTPLSSLPQPASKPAFPPRPLFFIPNPPLVSYTKGFFDTDTVLLDLFEDMQEKGNARLAPLQTDLANESDTYSINGRKFTVPEDAQERALLIQSITKSFNEGVRPLHINTLKEYNEYAEALGNIQASLKTSKEIPPGFFKISDNGSMINFFLSGEHISHLDLKYVLSPRGKNQPRVVITNPFGRGGPDQRIPPGSSGSGKSYEEGEPAGLPSPAHIFQGFFANLEIPIGPTSQRNLIPFDSGNFSTVAFLLNLNHAANRQRGEKLSINLKANPLIIAFFNDNGDGITYVPRLYYIDISGKVGRSLRQISYDKFVREMINLKYLVWQPYGWLKKWRSGNEGEYIFNAELLKD